MAYIGKQPTVGNFVKLDSITTSATDTFNLTNGTVAYSPQSANHCIVSLNGVIQSPTTSFTISGSTIVFASALTATDVIDFILVLGDVLNIGTPSDATVGFSKVTSNLITGATAETSIAGGDSVLIYDDSASALRKMTRTNFIGGGNAPNFSAYRNTNQSIANATQTKLVFNTETYDTASAYNTSTGTFTVPSGQAGKYFFLASTQIFSADDFDDNNISLRINGTAFIVGDNRRNEHYERFGLYTICNLSVSDTVEIYFIHSSGVTTDILGSQSQTYFQGFKLIE